MSENEGLCAYPNCTCRPEQRCPSVRSDPVNRPAHYRTGRIEVIDFLRDQGFCYLAGNVVKYVSRYRHKGKPLEDLKKARWYLQRLIGELEKEAGVMDEAQEKAVAKVAGLLSDARPTPPKCWESGRTVNEALKDGLRLCPRARDGQHDFAGTFPVRDDSGYRYVAECHLCGACAYCDQPKDPK